MSSSNVVNKLISEVEELKELTHALNEYADKLEYVANMVRRFVSGEVTVDEVAKLYNLSPAGDGYGCDTYYIAPDVTCECADAVQLMTYVSQAHERIMEIAKEGVNGNGSSH